MARRTIKKATEKRVQPPVEQRRPAGIQAMDRKLYVQLQQALRFLECRT